VNGATRCTRLLGCSYLHPHVIPDPHVNTVSLTNDDEFVVIANATFWSHITPDEAVAEICDIVNPVAAAKRLQDLAQVKLTYRLQGRRRISVWSQILMLLVMFQGNCLLLTAVILDIFIRHKRIAKKIQLLLLWN